ncbi:hypothetical protein KYG33_08585 [Chryseobacterium sp. D764]|jgi:hypothetical protein|nr:MULTISPECIES: hypothetical protein [unclassified Chryseobacterium]QXU51082.1 hypothetical protein KYG33_08585 [Chryseobacterium sp. D764]CAD0220500.1 conserved protein of unknown function [Chryseobacterium sp. JV274]
MQKKKLYILIAVFIAVLLMFFTEYEVGTETGSWGRNRTINWGWNFGF